MTLICSSVGISSSLSGSSSSSSSSTRISSSSFFYRSRSLASLLNIPAWMILLSRAFLWVALNKIPSSTLVAVISLKTRTSCICPIRWARSFAYSSIWGFQSESKMMTVSDTWRLRPMPPAFVDRTNTFSGESGSWNRSSRFFLSSALVLPSRIK